MIIATSGGPASAADSTGKYAVRGVGSTTCSKFLAAAGDPAHVRPYLDWLMGYVSARNRLDNGIFDDLPTQQGTDLANAVAALCQRQPDALFESVADAALRIFAPLRQARESPLVSVEAGGKSVVVRRDALQRLQQALIDRKFYNGRADGASNARFIQALRDFQQSEKLPVTGLPGIDTFIRAVIKPQQG